MPFEPVILFFLLGLLAGLARSDLKIPAVLYESLSIFLLLAIGLKGGVELARQSLAELLLPALVIVGIGAVLPLIAFPVLQRLGKLSRADAASVAAHYGSVSVATTRSVFTLTSDRPRCAAPCQSAANGASLAGSTMPARIM